MPIRSVPTAIGNSIRLRPRALDSAIRPTAPDSAIRPTAIGSAVRPTAIGSAGGLAAGSGKIMFWYRRLPHWVPEDSIVFLTWRLAGTLPQPPTLLVADSDAGRRFLLHDRQLDLTRDGPRWLENPNIADSFVEALRYGERVRRSYDLLAWVVMPNHVHVVLKPHQKLPEILRWVKTATAVRANSIAGRTGHPFWQREYFDRWIRTDKELASVIAYVEANPVKAGLVGFAENWPWSSASKPTGGKTAGATGFR
jgi:REP element-mobilizing transposase RayT